jgi:fructokinase
MPPEVDAVPAVLVCGEALVDVFDAAPGNAIPGGSPFNAAVGLGRLDCPAAFLGGISTDDHGTLLIRALADAGVDTRYALRTDRPTPVAHVSTDEAGHPHYVFQVDRTADTALTPDALPATLPASIEAIALGSYPIAVAPMADALAALAAREGAHRVVSIDANVRPALVGDLAAWRQRFAALVAHATIVKASDEDLYTAFGSDCHVPTLAQGWIEAGVSLVIVTLGPAGATAFFGSRSTTVPGQAVQVVDTVGAGDSFHAALLARLHARGLLERGALQRIASTDVDDALRYAIAAASITCTRAGADPPTCADMEAAGFR